jgi:hypothetical protein
MNVLSHDLIHAIARCFRAGGDLALAAAYNGLDLTELKGWMRRGRREFRRIQRGKEAVADEETCLQLYLEIRRSKAAFELRCANQLRKAANEGYYQAAIALLDRRSKRFLRKRPEQIRSLFKVPKTIIRGAVDERSIQ